MSVLLMRSFWDKSELAIEDPLLETTQVYWNHQEQPLIDEDTLEEVLEDVGFSTNQFFDAYEQALESRDTYLKQNIAETLYSKYGDERMLPVLVILSMQQHDIKQALQYLSQWDVRDPEFVQQIWVHTIIAILFNTTQLDSASIERVKSIITNYYEQWFFDDKAKYYYYSLLALAKEDWHHFDHYSNFLKEGDYADRFAKITKAKELANSYEYVPEYYYEGLLWIELFYEWRYNLAQQRGAKLLEKDNGYLLWYQLQAYSAMLLSQWQKASEMFENIKQKDDSELFVLLQAISLYQSSVYTESVFQLKGLDTWEYALDALRYLFLSYYKLWDAKWVYWTIEQLLWEELTPYDYFSLFDMLLFSNNQFDDETESAWLINEIIRQCHKDIWNTHGFICLYGKSWVLYGDKEYEKSLAIMKWLTQWYPTSTLYERIGDIAYKLWDTSLARKSFLKAFASSRNDSELSALRNRVTSLLQ